MKAKLVIVSIQCFLLGNLLFNCGEIALAKDNDTQVTQTTSTREHEWRHELEHSSMEYRSPVKEAFKGAFFGGAVGLGTGLSVGGIHAAYGGEGKYFGRIVTPFLAAGIIGGALYGFYDAGRQNDKSEKRESTMIEKYGMVSPTVFSTASAKPGYGLSYSLTLGN